MKVPVTGNARFIGHHTARRLLERGDTVIGFDVVNDHYDLALKQARPGRPELVARETRAEYQFIQNNLADRGAVDACFADNRFVRGIHLAAQAGV